MDRGVTRGIKKSFSFLNRAGSGEAMEQSDLREQLIIMLSWQDAHVSFDDAVKDIPTDLQGVQPAGLPYSPWQLLEHIRLAQRDILNFCRDAAYESPKW